MQRSPVCVDPSWSKSRRKVRWLIIGVQERTLSSRFHSSQLIPQLSSPARGDRFIPATRGLARVLSCYFLSGVVIIGLASASFVVMISGRDSPPSAGAACGSDDVMALVTAVIT